MAINSYIDSVENEAQKATLISLRNIINTTVPDATELISYGVPTVKYKHRPLIGFAAQTNHVAVYTISKSLILKLSDELKNYNASGTTIKFNPNIPLPTELIVQILQTRMAEIDKQNPQHF